MNKMNKMLLAATALAVVIAAPAFAQSYDPSVGSGNIAAGAQAAPSAVYQGAQGAFARVAPGATRPQSSDVVRDEHGTVIGADPDPNVRLQLLKDHNEIE